MDPFSDPNSGRLGAVHNQCGSRSKTISSEDGQLLRGGVGALTDLWRAVQPSTLPRTQ